MTVAIVLQVHDGVVLASDSAWTLFNQSTPGQRNITNVYDNGNKIFNLYKGLPIGCVFYGMASIGSANMSTLMKDFRVELVNSLIKDNYKIEQVAVALRQFLYEDRIVPLNMQPPGENLGLFVAGYSAGAALSEVWSIELNNLVCAAPRLLIGQGIAGVNAGGDPDPFCRLLNGYSVYAEQAMRSANIDAAIIFKLAMDNALPANFVQAPMPIKDAVDMAEYLVEMTANFAKFRPGSATVGGPTESAAITKHEDFRWVKRKHYFTRELNPGASL